jgi:hypothetical protein
MLSISINEKWVLPGVIYIPTELLINYAVIVHS